MWYYIQVYQQDDRRQRKANEAKNLGLMTAPEASLFCCKDCRRVRYLLFVLQMHKVDGHLLLYRGLFHMSDMSGHDGLCTICERARLALPKPIHKKDPHSLPTRIRCPRCCLTLQASEFHVCNSRPTGRNGYCKACWRDYVKSRRHGGKSP